MNDENGSMSPPAEKAVTSLKSWIMFGVIVLASLVVNYQGWRGQLTGLDYDMPINTDDAIQFLDSRRLPLHGGVSSRGGRNPPGFSWFHMPGLLTHDLLKMERVGAAFVHLFSVFGLWCLARKIVDDRAALLAVAVYSFSAIGLNYGMSLGPRSLAFPYIWLSYFLIQWASTRNSWYLTGALTAYSIGCFLFLADLPAILAIAAVWIVRRPPITWYSVLVAIVVSLGIWFPYLKLQMGNGFDDVLSQVTRPRTMTAAYAPIYKYAPDVQTWNEVNHEFTDFRLEIAAEGEKSFRSTAHNIFFRCYYAVTIFFGIVLFKTPLGILAIPLFYLPLIAFCSRILQAGKWLMRLQILTWLGIAIAVAALIGNPLVAQKIMGRELDSDESFKIYLVEGLLLALGIALVARQWTARMLEKIESIWSDNDYRSTENLNRFTFWLILLAPFFPMLIVAKLLRYCFWFWGVLVILLGMGASYYPRKRFGNAWWIFGLEVAAFCIMTFNHVGISHVQSYAKSGYAGEKASLIKTMDLVHEKFSKANHTSPKIGYFLFFNGFEVLNHEFDQRYKIGFPDDCYLRIQYGMENQSLNTEGFSREDDVRILEKKTRPGKTQRFRFKDRENFHLWTVVDDNYEVWVRNGTTIFADPPEEKN